MATLDPSVVSSSGFLLRFDSLHQQGRGFAFPCNAAGEVDLDALSDRSRDCYFSARALMGRDFRCPTVIPADHAH